MQHLAETSNDLHLENAEDADVHSSSSEYAKRFSSETGRWMLDVQEHFTLGMLDPETISVIDVGGGHGQIAIPLMNAHRNVTVLGSSLKCSQQLDQYIANGMISFSVGSLISIPFPNQAFDAAVCFRFISHCTEWRQLIAELCRVSRHSVILDYPTWVSINFLSPLLFKLKKKIEGNTRTFEVFSHSQIKNEFKKHGFRCEVLKKQFLFPMALHRMTKSVRVAKALETFARCTGLTALFGSPCIVKMVRI